jgi:hypothetical protein
VTIEDIGVAANPPLRPLRFLKHPFHSVGGYGSRGGLIEQGTVDSPWARLSPKRN